MKRALLITCVSFASCATHRESAVQVDEAAQQQEESHAAESVEIHRTEEPSRTVTTIEEFGAPEPSVPNSAASSGRTTEATASPRAPSGLVPQLGSGPVVLPFRGPLIKLTTITEDRGAVLETATAKGSSESTAAAREALSGKGDSEADSKPSLGLPVLGLVLAGIAASAILTRGIWLGPLISFLKSKLGGST